MNSSAAGPLRARLHSEPLAVLRALPGMGRVMLAVRSEGITHERMGVVEDVTVIGSQAHCVGSTHDAQIEYPAIDAIIIDRSGHMKDQALPRIDFLARDGETLISATGLDGLERFDAALRPLGTVEALPEPKRAPSPQSTVSEADAAVAPLSAASRTRVPIAIEFHQPAVVQRWRGTVEAVVAAMGFVNIIEPDFHLHVRGGTVTYWGRRAVPPAVELAAAGADGTPLGLVLIGDASAFGGP